MCFLYDIINIIILLLTNIRFNDGFWSLIEVKLSGEENINQAFNNLLIIANDINIEKNW